MKLIQIRNVPDDVHRKLKVRAAERGTTLSALAYEAVVDYASRPTIQEFNARLRTQEHVRLEGGGAAAVAEARAERERDIERATRRR